MYIKNTSDEEWTLNIVLEGDDEVFRYEILPERDSKGVYVWRVF